MGIGTILIGAALFIIVALYTASPLFETRRPAIAPLNHQQTLELERAAIVRTIRELDLDYRTGKLNEADYKGLREAQVQRGAETLRELDEISRNTEVNTEVNTEATADAEAQMQAKIDAVAEAESEAQMTAQIEARIAELRRTASVCKSCGKPLRDGDRFCASCGALTSPILNSKKTLGARR